MNWPADFAENDLAIAPADCLEHWDLKERVSRLMNLSVVRLTKRIM
jgi:hypothetical protein